MIGGARYDKNGKLLTGRKNGSTGKELKKAYTIRAYPSEIEKLKGKGKTLQKAVDHGIKSLL